MIFVTVRQSCDLMLANGAVILNMDNSELKPFIQEPPEEAAITVLSCPHVQQELVHIRRVTLKSEQSSHPNAFLAHERLQWFLNLVKDWGELCSGLDGVSVIWVSKHQVGEDPSLHGPKTVFGSVMADRLCLNLRSNILIKHINFIRNYQTHHSKKNWSAITPISN